MKKRIVCLGLFFGIFLMGQDARVVLVDPLKVTAETVALVATEMQIVGEALELRFGHDDDWPHIKFDAGKAYARSDWQDFAYLSLTVSNPSDKDVRLCVRIDDSPEANGNVHCRQGNALLPAKTRREVLFSLGTEIIEGMRGQPRQKGVDLSEALVISPPSRGLDYSQMIAFQIFMAKPKEDFVLRLHRVEMLRKAEKKEKAFVDRYGQYMDEDWPGKIHGEADFEKQRNEERADLATNPSFADRDRFGGWKGGPKLEATGRFRVVKQNGCWWFVDPEGHLFWSAGITCVNPSSSGPMLGRQEYFSWLPEPGKAPLGKFYSDKGKGWLDFGKINLYRKYGEDWARVSHVLAMDRMQSWGFNTIGNWSDRSVWDLKRMPYTIPVHYKCPRVKIWERRSFPDVFHPEFEKGVRDGVARHAERKDDPWLLGVFIDNELPWRGWGKTQSTLMVCKFLAADTPMATRKVMLDELRKKYGAISDLNVAWGTELADWSGFSGLELNADQRAKADDDLQALRDLVAEKYFGVCRKAMREVLPGVLYFGPRFSSFDRSVVKIGAKYCDVVCFNLYSYLPDNREADEYAAEFDFPVIIGEYHFGALDRGMFHTGLRKAKNQDDRAEKFATYLTAAGSAPWCVGAHWFQYRDQMLTGRFDGENYNIGFVNIADYPYPEMRAAARRVNRALYAKRLNGK